MKVLRQTIAILLLFEYTSGFHKYQKPNYCSMVKNHSEMCGIPNFKLPHIGCTARRGRWSSNCTSPVFIRRDHQFVGQMLKEHNFYRNRVALGKLKNSHGIKFPKAARMATIRWSKELSDLACLNVRQCEMKHDHCRSTKRFMVAGQNLAYISIYNSNPKRYPPVPRILSKMMRSWFNEYEKVQNLTVLESCCGKNATKTLSKIGHFTGMIQQKSTHLGCCAARYLNHTLDKQIIFNTTLLACNYAYTNMGGEPIYEFAERAAEMCIKGTNPKFKGLCAVEEPISAKPFFKVEIPKNMAKMGLEKWVDVPDGFVLKIIWT